MLRLTKALPIRTAQLRLFSMASVRAAEGDAGATRPGGAASGDAFTKREKANEDMYVREQEKQKLLELKEKLKKQQEELAKLDEHIAEMEEKNNRE